MGFFSTSKPSSTSSPTPSPSLKPVAVAVRASFSLASFKRKKTAVKTSKSKVSPTIIPSTNSQEMVATAPSNPSPLLTQTSSQKRSGKSVCGTEEWLQWCSENQVLIGQIPELNHNEIEACRRHFLTLKFTPSAVGVNPKTLADSFYRAEVFSSPTEALLFCQKLGQTPDSLITFTDLLNAAHGTSFFKKNKVTTYIRFVASSSVFHPILESSQRRRLSISNHPINETVVEGTTTDLTAASSSSSCSTSPGQQGIVIARHASNGSVISIQPRKSSLQRQDSTEQYQKFILKRSYTRSESSERVPVTSSSSQESSSPSSQPSLQRQESGTFARPLPRTKVAAMKIYATNKFLSSRNYLESPFVASPSTTPSS